MVLPVYLKGWGENRWRRVFRMGNEIKGRWY